jgi:hypothetical protein
MLLSVAISINLADSAIGGPVAKWKSTRKRATLSTKGHRRESSSPALAITIE